MIISQAFITPYTPEQNGLIERFFRSLKEECV
ncbi:MAG: transposase [Nitrospirales bacterium]|nr:transposase [Nitrospirales bacterium]